MAEKQFPVAVKDFRQSSKVLEFKKEDKDCIILDRKLMDKQDRIEVRMLNITVNQKIQLEIC